MKNEWTQIDLFSGANAFRMGFENAGFNIVEHHYSEIDKHAIATSEYNFPKSRHLGSVEYVSGFEFRNRRTFVTFGWPCQDNSIAGKRQGHAPGTRSGLLSQAVRVIDEARPEFFTAENVEGLRTVNKGIDIVEAIKRLAFLNEGLPQYDIEMQLLNTRWFLPQNRERLYFVGHLRDGSRKQVFPIGEDFAGTYEGKGKATTIRCFTAGGNSGGLQSNMTLIQKDYTKGNAQGGRVYSSEGVACAHSSSGGGVGAATGLYEVNTITNRPHGFFKGSESDICPTFNAQSSKDNLYVNGVRRLTPIEAERLQGWPDNWTKYGIYSGTVKQVSDTQRYKICGNGVSEPCVRAVAQKLYKLYH